MDLIIHLLCFFTENNYNLVLFALNQAETGFFHKGKA
jgi:hypothetical protein